MIKLEKKPQNDGIIPQICLSTNYTYTMQFACQQRNHAQKAILLALK
jgi:hypothetical protein